MRQHDSVWVKKDTVEALTHDTLSAGSQSTKSLACTESASLSQAGRERLPLGRSWGRIERIGRI